MAAGVSGIGPLGGLAGVVQQPIAGQVRDFNPALYFKTKRLPVLDRTAMFALVAAREALAQAQLDPVRDGLADRAGVVIGTGVGGQTSHDEQLRRLYAGDGRVHPLAILRIMASAPAAQLSLEFGITGPVFAVTSACASSNHALAEAAQLIRSQRADVVLAGGADACITFGTIKAWEAMRVMADDACRPFSAGRRGMVMSEGAGVFVLEAREHALARGATILAELAGAGLSADAADLVMPSIAGAAKAMRLALDEARLPPDAIGYINAHGTGTLANDVTETRAIHDVFGGHAQYLGISSTKSMHGHAMGAAGAIELLAAVNALRFGLIPPTINFQAKDPDCDLDYTANVAKHRPLEAVLSNSFAFGGMNAVIALRRA